MLELTLIFSTALLVGLSGALMPGPLTAVTVEHALRRGYRAAPLATLGHALLEVIMVLLLLVGLGSYLALPPVAGGIGLAGGLVLAWMGYGMIRSAARATLTPDAASGEGRRGSPFWGGLVSTISNPYWFLWWATIGAGYVALSRNHGLAGVFSFYSGHILADFLWLSLLAIAAVSGKGRLTDKIYRWIIFGLGVFLCLFSLYFFWSGLRIIQGHLKLQDSLSAAPHNAKLPATRATGYLWTNSGCNYHYVFSHGFLVYQELQIENSSLWDGGLEDKPYEGVEPAVK